MVSSARAADECNRIPGQELPPEEEKAYEKDALEAKERELETWPQFKVYTPMEPGKCNKEVVGTRRVLTWKMVGGVKTVKARLVAKGYQDPDLWSRGNLGKCELTALPSSSRVPRTSTRMEAMEAWSLQADGFGRDVFIQSPPEWLPGDPRRFWELNATAYGLDDAPVAVHRSLKRYLLDGRAPTSAVGLRIKVSEFDPCLVFVFRRDCLAAGVIATRIDDLLGCG